MKKLFALIFTLMLCADGFAQIDVDATDVGLGYARTSVNTAIYRQNALTTCRDTQFVAFYDSDGFLVLGKRYVGGGEAGQFELKRSQYKIQKPDDAHNIISIAADGNGYLHVAFDQHSSPLRYCRSVAPYSLTLGNLQPMVEGAQMLERNVTYPAFHNFSNGDLMFVYRNANGIVIYRYLLAEQQWRGMSMRLIEYDFAVRPYWQITVDGNDAIHLSWLWRDNVNDVRTNHGIYYVCSSDYGRTWHTADGKTVAPPFRRQNMAPVVNIPQNSNLINQTSMATDPDGRPYIATYYRKDSITNYHLIYWDGNRMNDVIVGNRTTDFDLGGVGTLHPPISRPLAITDGKMVYYFVRDSQEDSAPTMYYAAIQTGRQPIFHCIHLAADNLDAWEPIVDLALWKQQHRILLFVQKTAQQHGDRPTDQPPTMVKVLEITPNLQETPPRQR
ncbi:MAG: BNR repeat-containing protein [Bacteroidales bacterium]|nr:BNR repeat-containing protein [Bacteroidales bacterium]